jgi:hypothetical protein
MGLKTAISINLPTFSVPIHLCELTERKEIKQNASPWSNKNSERSSTTARHMIYRALFTNILSSRNNTFLIRGQKKQYYYKNLPLDNAHT